MTPGPWIVSPTKHRTLIVSKEGFQVAALDDVNDGNARLMAAAPDLLCALKDAKFMVWHMTGNAAEAAPWNALLSRIDAAISAATGEGQQ